MFQFNHSLNVPTTLQTPVLLLRRRINAVHVQPLGIRFSQTPNYAVPYKDIVQCLNRARLQRKLAMFCLRRVAPAYAAARSTGLGIAANSRAALWTVAVEVDKFDCGLHIDCLLSLS